MSEAVLEGYLKLASPLAARRPAKARRDGIVELHEKDEPDAPVGIEQAQERAERVQRLCGHNAPIDGRLDVRGRLLARQMRSFGITPGAVENDSEEEHIAPINQKRRAVFDEFGEQRGREGHDRNRREKPDVQPRKITGRARELIQLRLLSDPEDAKCQKAHRVHDKARQERDQRAPQLSLGMNGAHRRNMDVQHQQRHCEREYAIAQCRQTLERASGNPVVDRLVSEQGSGLPLRAQVFEKTPGRNGFPLPAARQRAPRPDGHKAVLLLIHCLLPRLVVKVKDGK